VLKFSNDGTFLLNIGDPGFDGPDSNDTDGAANGTPQPYNAADIEVDSKANEAYIADGYGNHRVLVVDADTGLYKRHWAPTAPTRSTMPLPMPSGPTPRTGTTASRRSASAIRSIACG
jgi:hypothetical protein